MSYTIEELKERLADLTERNRQERIERGLPPESPEDFVEIPISIILAEQIQPLFPIITKYASIIAAGSFIKFDTSMLERFQEPLELLRMSKGRDCSTMGSSARASISIMDEVNEAVVDEMVHTIDSDDVMRRLHGLLRLFKMSDPWDDAYDCLLDAVFDKQVAPIKAEYERLKSDDVYYQAELSKVRQEFESIKHLI